MATQPKPSFYEGQEFHNPSDPTAPVLVYTKKGGFIPQDQYLAQRHQDQSAFEDEAALLQRINGAENQVGDGWGNTGFLGGITKAIPGTAANKLDAALQPIRANELINQLMRMKQASPNGASGMGSLTEREGEKLQSLNGNLDIGQGGDQLKTNLGDVRAALIRHTPGLTADNPIEFSQDNARTIPQGAWFRAPDGKVYRNQKGAGVPWAGTQRAAANAALKARSAPAPAVTDGGVVDIFGRPVR